MELTSPNAIKEILQRHNAKPSRGLGQNFLIDKNILTKIVDAAEIKKNDFILEVGPGIGVLTQELAQKASKIVAVEKDKTMSEILKKTLANFRNIEIINSDALKFENCDVFKNYKVVANIPYYITSPLIRKFLESKNPPSAIILMVQKEVAQRICAKPPKMSLLAVSVQFYAEPKIISYVSKNSFWPAPKIDSAIIKIVPYLPAGRREKNIPADLFFSVVRTGFSHPRKQLVNNLALLKNFNGVKLDKEKTSEWLLKNNIEPAQRAETLAVADWLNLIKNF